MGFFNKLIKSDCEGLIEAYLQTYKNIKNAPQYRAAAELFETETKLDKHFHYANSAVQARRYNGPQIEKVMMLFMERVKQYSMSTNSLTESQMLLALLIAAHHIEAGHNVNKNFEQIAAGYIGRNFTDQELTTNISITF
jgi:hypothetical protein